MIKAIPVPLTYSPPDVCRLMDTYRNMECDPDKGGYSWAQIAGRFAQEIRIILPGAIRRAKRIYSNGNIESCVGPDVFFDESRSASPGSRLLAPIEIGSTITILSRRIVSKREFAWNSSRNVVDEKRVYDVLDWLAGSRTFDVSFMNEKNARNCNILRDNNGTTSYDPRLMFNRTVVDVMMLFSEIYDCLAIGNNGVLCSVSSAIIHTSSFDINSEIKANNKR